MNTPTKRSKSESRQPRSNVLRSRINQVFSTQDYRDALISYERPADPSARYDVNTPLVSWLRQMQLASWLREKTIKEVIQTKCHSTIQKLAKRTMDLHRQHTEIRSEVEMWQMRNEELESRLFYQSEKTWKLKQLALDQQQQLKK